MATTAAPQLAVACILERWYSLSTESTLQAAGFDDELTIINAVDPSEDVVASTLPPADRAWAAQHVSVWRKCGLGDVPYLIFQDTTGFKSSVDVHATIRGLVAAVQEVQAQVQAQASDAVCMCLSAAEADHEASESALIISKAAAGSFTLQPSRSASQDAYVLWPGAARTLLAALPLNAPVSAVLDDHARKRSICAVVVSPALAIPGDA